MGKEVLIQYEDSLMVWQGLLSPAFMVGGAVSLLDAFKKGKDALKDLDVTLKRFKVVKTSEECVLFKCLDTGGHFLLFEAYGVYRLGYVQLDGGAWVTRGKWLFPEPIYAYILNLL